MSTEENKAQIRRIVEEGWNKGNIAALDDLISPDFLNHTPSNPNETREEFEVRVMMFRSAFPDFVMTIEEMIGEGDLVATRFTGRGTHRADFRGIPASGKQVEFMGMAVDRFVNGKRVEGWALSDIEGLLQQLGGPPS